MKEKTQIIILSAVIILVLSILIKFIAFSPRTAIDIQKSCLGNLNQKIAEEGITEFLKFPEQLLKSSSWVEHTSSVNSVADYLMCKAIVANNMSECEKLGEIKVPGYNYDANSNIRACEDFLKFFAGFLNKVQKEQKCEQETINNCIQIMEGNSEKEKEMKCKNFCQAYLAKDVSICSEPLKTKVNSIENKECLALITGDIKYCKDLKFPASVKQCILANQYFNAIRSEDENMCKLVQKDLQLPNYKMLCELYFDKDIKVCKKELETFEKNYCKHEAKSLLKNIIYFLKKW